MTRMFPDLQNEKLYRDAKAIREWLCNLSGLIPRLNEDPNPFYGNTVSGLSLIEYYGGPSSVGTPFGSWTCTGGGCIDNPTWQEEAIERLGLELSMPETTTSEGVYGPIWRITKNLDGEPLPQFEAKHLIAFPGIQGKSYLSQLNLPMEEMRVEVENRLAKMRKERTSEFFNAGQSEYVIPADISRHMLEYDLYKALWHEMKTKIGYVAWDDRVHPEFYPHSCYSQDDVNKHLVSMGYPTSGILMEKGQKIYGVVGSDSQTHYLIIAKDWPTNLIRMVCRDLRDPTEEEKTMAQKLLAARGYTW